MDEATGSSEVLHGSPRNNDLLALICNVINPSCSANQSGIAGANIVVTAGIADDIIPNLPNTATEESDSAVADCSCSPIEDSIDPNEEVSVTEEEIAGLGDIGPEIIESVTCASGQQESREELIRENNILKTVDDINNSHLNQEITMPQSNALVETASIASMSSSNLTAGDYLSGSVQSTIGVDPDQGSFAVQNWTLEAVNSGISPSPASCDASVLNNRQQAYKHAAMTAHGLSTIDGTYVPGLYVNQHQFNLPGHDQGLLGNHLLQNTPFTVQDYSSPLLRPENWPNSRTQDLTSLSSAHQMDVYHQITGYAPVPASVAHTQDANLILTNAAFNFNNNARNGSRQDRLLKERGDSGSEESLSEDRSQEKKLTITPIPSDAEKTLNSGSSDSSGSHEESPSPTASRVKGPSIDHSSSCSNPYVGANFHELVPPAAHENYVSGDAMVNDDVVLNAIPVPENVVEIGDNSVKDYSCVDAALSVVNVPASSATTKSAMPQRDATSSFHSVKASPRNPSDSWLTAKEERRKRKLHHKKHKKSKHQESAPASNTCADAGVTPDNLAPRPAVDVSGGVEKPRHRVKHYQQLSDVTATSKHLFTPSEQLTVENSLLAQTPYSNLLPKTTADPIGSVGVPVCDKSVASVSWNQKSKESSSKKTFDKLKKKRNATNYSSLVIAGQTTTSTPTSNQNCFAGESELRSPGRGVSSSTGKVIPSSGATGVRRWQTVTAVQDPKLPPMLSERDRIPKRGRPSKQMKEMNLKCKSPFDLPDATPTTTAATTTATTVAVKLAVKPNESASRTVSMYTINDKGLIEVLNSKPKENRRSKERAEAFRNMLTEISKKSSIQKKTAGAKEVIGAFKAVGVRTRKQALTGVLTEDKKKQVKLKPKPSPAAETAACNERVEDKDGMYTFKELAKQFNISNSILYRAMEQWQRSKVAKVKQPKLPNKAKQCVEKKAEKPVRSAVSQPVEKKPLKLLKPPAPLKQFDESSQEANMLSEPKKLPTSVVSSEPQHCENAVPAAAVATRNSPKISVASVEPAAVAAAQPEGEKVKRKKKKKKHKKEKRDGIKKKKTKEKKRKKKRFKPDSHVPPVASAAVEEAKSKDTPSVQPSTENSICQTDVVPISLSQKTPSVSTESTTKSLPRPGSISSLSAPEEDNDYDGGDSSSDVDIANAVPTSVSAVISPLLKSPTTPPLCTGKTQVFGSCLSSSSLMPSFQGIKEHGGLMQLSEHARKMEELRDARSKKHKHKKKKPGRRSKNVSDPTFLNNMEELVAWLERAKISGSVPFVSGSGLAKSTNVFACDFVGRTKLFQNGGMAVEDALSYRDPARNRSRSKRPSYQPQAVAARKTVPPERFAHLSSFCRASFFVEHGFVKPCTSDAAASFFKPVSAKLSKTNVYPPADTVQTETPLAFSPALLSAPKAMEPHAVKRKAETSTANKKQRKRRGWPLGKPRGPRSKKPSLDEDLSDTSADAGQESVVRSDVCGSRHHNKTRDESKPSQNSNNQNTESQEVDMKLSGKHNTTDAQHEDALRNDSSASKVSSSSEPQISHDLVDHIKAAIAAKLNAANVSSEIVAKTVDTAVKDYLSKVGVSESTVADQQVSKTKVPVNARHRKTRGRPPKCMVSPSTEVNPAAGEPGQGISAEQSKPSDKPKKFWASKHQVTSAGGSSSNENQTAIVQTKRGPGRPRKYPIASSIARKAVSRAAGTSRLPARGSDRSSTSSTVHLRNTTQRWPSRRAGGNGRKLVSRALAGKAKRRGGARLPRENIVSGQQAKVAARSLICGKSLQQHVQSSAWLAAVSAPEPGIYEGTVIGRHIDEAIDATVKSVQRCQSGEGSKFGSRMTGSENCPKALPKKSIENVVAKLKRKQVDGRHPAYGNFNNNHSVDPVRKTAQLTTEKRPRGRPRKEDAVDDVVPAKRSKLSNSCNVREPEPSARQSLCPVDISPEEQKVFQTAGLFSTAFKAGSLDDFSFDGHDQCPLFPPPLHAGRFLRKTRKDFQLPYNIWWLYNKKLIHPRQDPATQFIKIQKNIYVDTQPSAEQEEHICVCKTLSDIRASGTSADTEGCGKQCLNRLMYIECSPDTCPCGDQCGNRAIQSNQWCPGLERFRTFDRGWGVKTNSPVSEGQFILEYVGEVVSDREFRRRTIENYNAHSDHYCIQLEAGKVIDGYRMANEGRFVNHSCMPNCEMQRWVVNGEYRLGLFAKRNIPAGEELTYDYNFHAYNLDRQQPCRCGTSECRGVIGGKTQRLYAESILNRVSKTSRSTLTGPAKSKKSPSVDHGVRIFTTFCESGEKVGVREIDSEQTPLITAKERNFIKRHKFILLRNIEQVKRAKERKQRPVQSQGSRKGGLGTRRPEPDDKVTKRNVSSVEEAIKDVFTAVMTCKDENGVSVAIPFINLPSKLQNHEHNQQHVTDLVDLNYVEQKIMTDQYDKFESFCSDIRRVFRNAEKYHGRKSTLGRDVTRLRKSFTMARTAAYSKLGEVTVKTKKKDARVEQELLEERKNSDYIRCICGIYKDEGLMIQCEKCYVWQHCDCMGVVLEEYSDERAYLCEECDERDLPVEIEVIPQPPNAPPGHTFYLTLKKDSLLVKQGDCVRIIHDHCLRQRPSNNPPVRTSYRLQSNSTPDRMDFFRVKKLWTDDNGDKFAYGHHFVRPQDAKHAELRKFFPNELIATPFHEIVPLEAVVNICCVMDLETYCLGKPKGVKDSDIYICQHRCNLSLRIVEKPLKTRYPIYTKPHVFETYAERLCPVRDYLVSEHLRKTQARRMQWLQATQHGTKSDSEDSSGAEDCSVANFEDYDDIYRNPAEETEVPRGSRTDDCQTGANKGRNEKQERLNEILSKLHSHATARF